MVGVLFVCLGNICRSPAAEGVFTKLAQDEGWLGGSPRITIASAGTGDWHIGRPPDPRMQATAKARGFDLSRLRAQQVTPEDIAKFQYVLAMDRDNLADLRRLAPKPHRERPQLFLSLDPALKILDVPDPYYGGDEGFEHCLDLIEAGSTALFEKIRSEHFA